VEANKRGEGEGGKKNGDSKRRGKRRKERPEIWEFLEIKHGRWSWSAGESEGNIVEDWMAIMPDAR